MLTPQAIDFYSRYMDALFDEGEFIETGTVFQQFFGKPQNNMSKTIYSPNSEVIDIDIMRRNRRIAAMIHRGTDSTHLNMMQNTVTQNFSTFSRVFPLCEELGDITASQINKRMAGENPYDGAMRADRTRALAREHHLEHMRRYIRLFEVLCGLSLMSGQMPALMGNNTANWYDFMRNPAHIVAPAIPWDDPAIGIGILTDIDFACEQIEINGKAIPNVLFLGKSIMPVFLRNADIGNIANNWRFEFIRFGDRGFQVPANLQDLVNAGATPLGQLFTPNGRTLFVFGYNAVVDDDNGDPVNLMPVATAFIAAYGARCDRYFGPPERLPLTSADAQWYQEMFGMNINAPIMPTNVKGSGIVTPQMFYSDAFRSGDAKKVTIRTQSAPIFATTQTDAFFTYHHTLGISS